MSARRDLGGMVICVLLIVLGAAAIYAARDFTKLGAVFPRTIGAALIFFSLMYIGMAWFRPAVTEVPQPGSVLRRVLLMAVMLGWALLLKPLGFLSSSVLAYCAILLIAQYDKWTPVMAIYYAVIGSGIVIGMYCLFRFALKVPLPVGLLL